MTKVAWLGGGLLLLTVGFGLGWRAAWRQVSLQPPPTKAEPVAEQPRFANESAKVVSYNGRSLRVKLERGEEREFADLAEAGVWVAVVGKEPQKADWNSVKPGASVMVAYGRETGKLSAVLVYQ